jgi:ABC-type multidrug transport system ATPase subunit
MTDAVIELSQVKKSFGKHAVLKNLDLFVPVNSIFAFLGNNGEGKSTAIRLIVGLLQADSGTIEVFGRNISVDRKKILSEVGCIVDAPSAYPNLTAREFLKIACVIKNLPAKEIDRVLDLVKLEVDKQRRISQFSLGMKQRLALAHALLGKPRLLLLDEPMNGLDPSGIQEIRQLMQRLPEEAQCTVFVSSHQLDEVEKVATHLALLKDGKLQFQSKLEDIYASQAGALCLSVDDADQASLVLSQHNFNSSKINARQLRVHSIAQDYSHQVNACLIQANLRLHQSVFEKPSLEQWFHQRTQENVA